jgi:hypothetical protein
MRLWCAAACLVALPAFAYGQSLGEAARKERERREKTREAGGSARTLTEEDLATTKGTLANDPKAPPATTAAPRTTGTTSGSGLAYSPIPVGASPETREEYWRRRVAQAQARVEQARRRNDAFQLMIRFGQAGSYDANGRRVIYSIHQMKAMADAAAAELAAAQAALEGVLEDGRRSGAQPGWLR